jgi:hypothetical protein
VEYHPTYFVNYDVDARFETSVGLLHHEFVQGVWIGFDGLSGASLPAEQLRRIGQEQSSPFLGLSPGAENHVSEFQVDLSNLLQTAKSTIRRIHTRTIGYIGANNVSYSKRCEPSDREVHIREVRELYVPYVHCNFQLGATAYSATAFHAPSGSWWPMGDNLRVCGICRGTIPGAGHAILCACGRICHPGRSPKKAHGFRCQKCERTVCRLHGYWTRRYLILRSMICVVCAKQTKAGGKTVAKLEALQTAATT